MADQVRFGWEDKSEAYRRRLERNGISRSDWEQGADLRAARGHKPEPKVSRTREKALERIINRNSTDLDRDYKTLQRGFRWPRWVPKELPDNGAVTYDVAVALSQLPPPSRWKSVDFVPRPDGQAWTMTVVPKGRAYPVVIDIPGGGGAGTGARQILEIMTLLEKGPVKKQPTAADAVFFEVMGSA